MTDPHDLDDLASAHLDGATSPAEAARVAADPELQSRVEELRAVREAMRDLPPVDPERREAAVAAALAAFDEDDADHAALRPVTPLASRRGLSPRAVQVLGAAAVIALIALLGSLITSSDDDDSASEDAATSFEETGAALGDEGAAESGDGGEDAAPAPAAGGAAGSGGPAASVALGAFEDLDALAAAVAEDSGAGLLAERSAAADTQESAFEDSSDLRCGAASPDATRAGSALVAGETVEVYLEPAPDGGWTMTVLAQDGCELLDQRVLP